MSCFVSFPYLIELLCIISLVVVHTELDREDEHNKNILRHVKCWVEYIYYYTNNNNNIYHELLLLSTCISEFLYIYLET